MNELALFAGAGGGILGGHLLGWRTICAVEWEPYPASVLAARQNDKILPPFPIWDDVQTFNGTQWRGRVDVVSGGFPCQDISAAGKGAGITGSRSSMWKHMAKIIGEVRPQYVYVENSPMLISRGINVVLGDLAEMGFDAEWGIVSAADVGANHLRKRIWIFAKQMGYAYYDGQSAAEITRSLIERSNPCSAKQIKTSEPTGSGEQYAELADANSAQQQGRCLPNRILQKYADVSRTSWWETEPDVGRVDNGVAARVDRLKAIGNGQVPRVAATAFNILKNQSTSKG